MPEDPNPSSSKEREFETGTDEFFKGHSQINALNNKRTFDEYQDLGLTSARRSQSNYDRLEALAIQAMQNAVETANMVGKQAVRHMDVAADNNWNPIQQGAGDNITAGSVPSNRVIDQETAVAGGSVSNATAAIASAVAKQVDATVTPVVAILQQLVQGIAAMNASMANVIAQVQPKEPSK